MTFSRADPTPKVQQEVIRLLIDHVVVEKDEIVIKHIIPVNNDCRLLPGRIHAVMDADLGVLLANNLRESFD